MMLKSLGCVALGALFISASVQAGDGDCQLRPLSMNLRDGGILVDGGFQIELFGTRATNGRPEGCVFGAVAKGVPSPRAFVEQGFEQVDKLKHSISISHVNFMPPPFNAVPKDSHIAEELPKLSFYAMEFSGSKPVKLSISAQALSATEFTLVVEAGGSVLTRNLSYTGLISNPNATVFVQSTAYDLTVSIGNDQMYFSGELIPDTARFGSLKEASVPQGSTVLFTASSSCTTSAGIALQNCMREP
jgi:hypothetical protein